MKLHDVSCDFVNGFATARAESRFGEDYTEARGGNGVFRARVLVGYQGTKRVGNGEKAGEKA